MTSLKEETVPSDTIEQQQQQQNHHHCLVCYSDLQHTAITACQHNEICGVCHLRLRYLHKDNKCPICKTEHTQIVVDRTDLAKPRFDDYPIWGNELGADFLFRTDVGIFFRKQYYQQHIQTLFGYYCTAPRCNFVAGGTTETTTTTDNTKGGTKTPLRSLQDHLRVKHRLTLCQLCVDHQRDFVARLPRYTPSQLQKHFTKGDADTGFHGHPTCEFCRPTRFYDITHLHTHLAKEHYKCHVCEQHLSLPNQYFKHYKSLEKHFDNMHFLCHNEQCRQARFVVFASELDLRAHERAVHGYTSTASVQLEFRVRRSTDQQQVVAPTAEEFNYTLDGTAFVPANLPTHHQENDIHTNTTQLLHPLHVQRTQQLREQAQAIRQEDSHNNHDTATAFPTLGDATSTSTTPSPGLRIGWATNTRQQQQQQRNHAVTDEAFPALPVGQRKLPPTRQLAAMNVSANRNSGWTGSVRSTQSATTTNNNKNNFPSLRVSRHNNNNRTANLTTENFPSLGGSHNTSHRAHRYTAADELARKHNHQSTTPSWNDATDFPAMNGSSSPMPRKTSQHPKERSIFTSVVKVDDSVTIEEMKTSMGSAKYKELKKYTQEFASTFMEPDAYVDHAATLFDRGYADRDFWRFLPTLIQSCPNKSASEQAMMYMENLQRMRNGAANAESTQKSVTNRFFQPPQPTNGWSTSAKARSVSQPPTASLHSSRTTTPQQQPSSSSFVQPKRVAAPRIVAAKSKNNAWGASTGPSPTVIAKAAPGSVALAAAKGTPKTGTATKFMAKEQKQHASSKTNKNGGTKGNGKKKNKNNSELRALAFGS